MHIHAGPTSLCVLSSLSFLCVCALGGSLCVSLSLGPQQHQTTCTTTNKCYNKIISKNIYIKRGAQSTIIYVYIYIMYICVYICLYICRIYRPCAQLNARPTARLPARPSELTDPPARPSRPFQKPTKQNQQCVMCAV